jgi:serine/threonine protein kinase
MSTAWKQQLHKLTQRLNKHPRENNPDEMNPQQVAQLCLATDAVSRKGHGGYGIVFANGTLAVKVPVNKHGEFSVTKTTRRELRTIKELKDAGIDFSNIVESEVVPGLHGVIFMPCADMTLKTYTRCNNVATVSLVAQLLNGLVAIESMGKTHGDLKPQNILVFVQGGSLVLKITDFGTMKKFTQKTFLDTTYAYTNPTTFITNILRHDGDGESLRAFDTWSFLCVLLELGGKRRVQAVQVPSDLNSFHAPHLFTLCTLRTMMLPWNWRTMTEQSLELDSEETATLAAHMQNGFEEYQEYASFWKSPTQTPFVDQINNLYHKETSTCEDAQTRYVYMALALEIMNDMGRMSATELFKTFTHRIIKESKSHIIGVKRKVIDLS